MKIYLVMSILAGLAVFCDVYCYAKSEYYSTSPYKKLTYDPINRKYVYTGTHDYLRYNPTNGKYQYADDNDRLRYNPIENKYEYADTYYNDISNKNH